ncbi:hypothetical protein ACFLZP_05150 [Patescibacteria group bacterium]
MVDLAYIQAVGVFLPYLLVGYNEEGWFFSNARNHTDSQAAVESDLGRKFDWTFEQVWFWPSDLAEGVLVFFSLNLNKKPPTSKRLKGFFYIYLRRIPL